LLINTTKSILFNEDEKLFHARNPFAFDGVNDVLVTGSVTVTLGGYLRDIGFKKEGQIEIIQGVDMKIPSKLYLSYKFELGIRIKASGYARLIRE